MRCGLLDRSSVLSFKHGRLEDYVCTAFGITIYSSVHYGRQLRAIFEPDRSHSRSGGVHVIGRGRNVRQVREEEDARTLAKGWMGQEVGRLVLFCDKGLVASVEGRKKMREKGRRRD